MSAPSIPIALTIAGSDSGGGAGIQADLKTFAALGVHGVSAITAITSQNTRAVEAIFPVPVAVVGQQIDAIATDLHPHATKTGMLGSAEIVSIVADRVQEYGLAPLVIDPVLASSSGTTLLDRDALRVLIERLLPLATVVTPNLVEVDVLGGGAPRSVPEMREAARRIQALGPHAVVVKGGHLPDDVEPVDVLLVGDEVFELPGRRLQQTATHGTGCSFASAIAAGLARGQGLLEAVTVAKELVAQAIQYGLPIGDGRGPVNPMAVLYRRSGLLD